MASRRLQDEWNEKMLKVNGEIDELNRQVDERNMALYEIRQQTMRNTNSESIFSKNYTPTILKNDEYQGSKKIDKTKVKNLKVGQAKPYCHLV